MTFYKLIIIIIVIIIIIIIQPHVKGDGTQHTKARLREVLKEKWKNKVMHGQYIRKCRIHVPLAIEGRPKSRN